MASSGTIHHQWMKLDFLKIASQLIRLLAYPFNNIISDFRNDSTVISNIVQKWDIDKSDKYEMISYFHQCNVKVVQRLLERLIPLNKWKVYHITTNKT